MKLKTANLKRGAKKAKCYKHVDVVKNGKVVCAKCGVHIGNGCRGTNWLDKMGETS